GQRNSIGIFLQGSYQDFCYRTVVSEVYDFGACLLQQSSVHLDGCIVPVEKGGGTYDANRMRSGHVTQCHNLRLQINEKCFRWDASEPCLQIRICMLPGLDSI